MLIFMVLGLVAVVAGPSAMAQQEPASAGTTKDDVIGASIVRPEGWLVERENYTYQDTYGYTLWRPESGDSHDHGGDPEVRVALAYDLEPGQIEGRVQEVIAAYPDLPMKREEVEVGKKYKGVAVGPIPGSSPSTEVYVPVEERVYQINVYGETLDAEGRKLLSDLSFYRPSRPVSSLGIPDANAPETLYKEVDPQLLERERAAKSPKTKSFEATPAERSGKAIEENRIKEGCWRADSRFFFQTQHGYGANRSGNDGIPTGFSIIGRPNFWGHYTHGNLGYGRCNERSYTNDYYAIDYPLNRGDVLFSPFKRGKVIFAGRNTTHKHYGIFVVIRASNGKYVSMSAHLNGLASGIRRGATVTDNTIIGYAGNSGHPSIPVGEVHLHQAYYRYPSYNRDGSPYGGAGLKAKYHHYVGTNTRPGGVYKFGWKHGSNTLTKGDRISN